MIYNRLTLKAFLSILFFTFSLSISAQPTSDAGKTLFKNYCAQCHAKDMKSVLTGPALAGLEDRWADYPREDLYAWIRNSQLMIANGHPRAVELWNEYKPTQMTAYPNLTVDEIESIILYVNETAAGVNKGPVGESTAVVAVEKSSNSWMYVLLLGVLAFLALILTRVIGSLNQIAAEKEGKTYQKKSLLETLTSKGVVGFVIFTLVVLGGYTTVNNAVGLGRQQGYAPDQPIKFSHETHAGINQIDCQYCHDGARRSKHAVIPAANTCMNCHKAIKEGSEYGTGEITKIYASVGYNPMTNKYIESYEEKSEDEIKAIYTAWMADRYLAEKGIDKLDREGERLVKEQWSDLVSSLTNDQKKTIAGPIEWTRIHNLPDHVYFNHSQHVNVGKVECQQCHGKVESMDVLEQHAPLSMGWCVNCHRQTEVKFGDNEYYQSYAKYHDEIEKGERDKVTVEDIGGLECQKCHY